MLPQRLRTARKANGLTQEELAERICTTKGTISNYENNHSTPPNDMLRQLADILNVTTDWLLGRTDTATPYTAAASSAPDNRSLDELLQERIENPDDYSFLVGYLEASEEEKKEIRRYWSDLNMQWKARQVK
ncbi:helix-turn-helix domain-containing protein [Brevibacillus sp. GCM10020057]|uniref:helix-turn-helix domain-containing protein n=1 Tax=Brevibacillus sp. GCM10020057 TaxID=3317327 RepID=UPI003633FF16